jgi:hypothetical protein
VPRISAAAFRALPLRVHTFLADVPLHDVWVVDLPRPRERVTLAAFHPFEGEKRAAGRLPPSARALFRLRFFLGRIFGLETEPKDAAATSFALRLTPEDRARCIVAPGTSAGAFRVVYRFENESLLEIHNRTVHAAMFYALGATTEGYRCYLAVYVANSNWLTPVYMALIDPFRRFLIYPALLRSIRAAWLEFEQPAP